MTKSQGACAGPGGDTGARWPSARPGSQGALRGSPPPCIQVRPDDLRGAFQLQLQQRRGPWKTPDHACPGAAPPCPQAPVTPAPHVAPTAAGMTSPMQPSEHWTPRRHLRPLTGKRTPQTGWLSGQTFIFHSSGGWESDVRGHRGWVLARALLWVTDSHFLMYFCAAVRQRELQGPLYKGSNLT